MAQAQDRNGDSSPIVWLIIGRAIWPLFWLMAAGVEVAVLVGVVGAVRQALGLNVGVYLAFAFIFAVGSVNAWRRRHRRSGATPDHQ